MELAEGHGNATVIKAGEEYFVMKVKMCKMLYDILDDKNFEIM